jgi:uncharacterized protein YutE (UPF0331/DUF86 family)
MVKPDVVRRKVARAVARLDEAEAILSQPSEAFLASAKDQDLASFYLFLAIQECIDLAAHWVSDAGWGSPDDAVSTFLLLADRRAIDRDLAEGLRGAAGLRNLIAHGYALVDHARIQSEYREGISSLRRFLTAVATEAGL